MAVEVVTVLDDILYLPMEVVRTPAPAQQLPRCWHGRNSTREESHSEQQPSRRQDFDVILNPECIRSAHRKQRK